MSVKLTGEITWKSGMDFSRLYQQGDTFVLESQSEMMSEPHYETFTNLTEAVNEMFRRT